MLCRRGAWSWLCRFPFAASNSPTCRISVFGRLHSSRAGLLRFPRQCSASFSSTSSSSSGKSERSRQEDELEAYRVRVGAPKDPGRSKMPDFTRLFPYDLGISSTETLPHLRLLASDLPQTNCPTSKHLSLPPPPYLAPPGQSPDTLVADLRTLAAGPYDKRRVGALCVHLRHARNENQLEHVIDILDELGKCNGGNGHYDKELMVALCTRLAGFVKVVVCEMWGCIYPFNCSPQLRVQCRPFRRPDNRTWSQCRPLRWPEVRIC
jgi:hypothetical protein